MEMASKFCTNPMPRSRLGAHSERSTQVVLDGADGEHPMGLDGHAAASAIVHKRK